jgi:hypothetical protein
VTGKNDGLTAEPDEHLPVCGLEVPESQAADHGCPLGVEEDEQSGQAVFGLEALVVEQSAGLFPAGLGVDHAGRAAPLGGREVQPGELVPACPADEVASVGAVGGLGVAQSCLEVALPRVLEGQPANGEPVEQGDGGPDVPPGADELAVGDVLSARRPQSQRTTCQTAYWCSSRRSAGPGAPGDALGDPDFQPGQLFVAGRQRRGGDEDRAQVPQRLAVGSSSRAAWVRGRSPVASWRSTAESLLLSSQLSTVPGRAARLSRSARSEDRPRRSGPGPDRIIKASRLIRS